MIHREERQFAIHFNLSAEFSEDYEGDDDGYAWFERFEHDLKPRILNAVFEVLQRDPKWEAVAAPRGRDPDTAIELDVRPRPALKD